MVMVMGSVLAQPDRMLIEPCPAPVIPVSGVGAVTQVAGGLVCVTLFQEMPSDVGAPALATECHVSARLIWPRSLIIPSIRELFAMLQEGPLATELASYRVRHH